MSPPALRLTLTGVLAAAIAAAFPVAAAAKLAPTVTVVQSAGSAAGSGATTGLEISFDQSAGDAVKGVSIALPPGLLFNESLSAGACLTASGPTASCQIGAGTAIVAGASKPMALYLVRPPQASDVGGVALIAGSVSVTGDLSFRSSLDVGVSPSLFVGLQVAFANLPAAPVSQLNFTLSDLRLPSGCSNPAANVAVWASSELSPTAVVARAPLPVTGCGALPYAPGIVSSVARDGSVNRASMVTTITQPAGQAATQMFTLSLPPGVLPNPELSPCVRGGTSCPIGTAVMTSPLLPVGALSHGTITLSGSPSSPTFTVTFPAPVALELSGSMSLSNGSLKLGDLPDIPFSSLVLSFTGTPGGAPFVTQLTSCRPAFFQNRFTPHSGVAPVTVKGVAIYSGCLGPPKPPKAGRPTVSASLTGLADGRPRLSLKSARGKRTPWVTSLSISLPRGLSFWAGALNARPCRPAQRGCPPQISRQALSLSGAKVRSARLHRGVLAIAFRRPYSRGSLTLGQPLLTESAALQRKAGSHRAGALKLTLRVADTSATATTLRLTVKGT